MRYAIDQGFFGPTARIVAGALFALALLAAGEWMRRRDLLSAAAEGGPVGDAGEPAVETEAGPATEPEASVRGRPLALAGLPPAPIPAVLTAAGTLAAFATAYAAHALYDMIGPAVAFVLLGAIGIATMAAAALHGPWLAALGLLGAFVAPILVSSADPKPWPVVIYLAVVAASAYALSRLRLWLWLAVATAIGSGLWALLIIEATFRNHLEAMVHILVQAALAAGFLAYDPHRGERDEHAAPDVVATVVLAGFAALAAMKLQVAGLGSGRPVFALAMLALLWATALRIPAVAGAGLLGAGVVLAALLGWPLAREIAQQSVTVLPGAPSNPPVPDALWQLLVLALLSGGALAAGAFVRLARTPVIARVATGLYAAAGVAGPLAILVLAWWRVTAFDRSIPFALVAVALAVGFVMAAAWFRRFAPPVIAAEAPAAAAPDVEAAEPQEEPPEDAVAFGARIAAFDPARSARYAVEACAAGAIAAIALGLTMVFEKGGLTVALAIAAAGAAWVTTREPVGTLRYAVGVIGVAVLGRLIWDPTIVGGDVGTIPIFNWLLWATACPPSASASPRCGCEGRRTTRWWLWRKGSPSHSPPSS